MSIILPVSQNQEIVPLDEFERRYIIEVLKSGGLVRYTPFYAV